MMATVATQEHFHPEDQTHAHEICQVREWMGWGGTWVEIASQNTGHGKSLKQSTPGEISTRKH